ncbi:MAG: hypothetical protein DSY66_02185 [Persephonella sp.]|nr:MAG: hypothetical protein DSY53_03630 [Persephonella sp.]RUM61419.1 MAG: hypothetical protein DSY66_02185 [Persephonella sp.]
MGKYILFIILFFTFNYSFGGDANTTEKISVEVPITSEIVIKLFYVILSALISYWFYFFLKNLILKAIFISISVYLISLILLDHFNIIEFNEKEIQKYFHYLGAIFLLFYNYVLSNLAIVLGIIIGILFALYNDEKIGIPKGKKSS